MNEQEIMVSIICNAYNQEKFIKDALDGFVNQKTNFRFEVLVHDDASTDNTPYIIKQYEKKYPEIIKPIYQVENKFSKGISITVGIQIPRAKGKYIALCEGDDYWIDENKLQLQYDCLENHPNIKMCAHSAQVIQNNEIINYIRPSKIEEIISVERTIEGGGAFYPTASLFFRKTMFDNNPDFFKKLYFDYTWQIFGSYDKGIYFIPKTMSVYRIFSGEYSWSSMMSKNIEKRNLHSKRVIEFLKEFNVFSNYNYKNSIEKSIDKIEFEILVREKKWKDAKKKNYYRNLSIIDKLKLNIKRVLGR